MSEQVNPADQLADKLDNLLIRGLPLPDDEPLVMAAARLMGAPRPEMPTAAIARIQGQVIEAQRRQTFRSSPQMRLMTLARRAAAACLVMAILAAGLTPAVASSIPGDWLYPVKKSVEQVELALATSDQAKAQVYLTHAERRADEALTLLERRRFNETLVSETLSGMAQAAEAARRAANPVVLLALQGRTVKVNALLSYVLSRASQDGIGPPEKIEALVEAVRDAQEDGRLLLPPTLTPEPTASDGSLAAPEASPTSTFTPTMTPSATPTLTATPTATPSATSTPTLTPSPSPTPLPTATPSPTPFINAIISATQLVNVRSGPGLSFEVIARMPPNTVLPVLGWNTDGTWLHVQLPDGRTGWIASSLLNVDDTSPIPTPYSPVITYEASDDFQTNVQPVDTNCGLPGEACNAPGHGGENPGSSGDTPGSSGSAPGHSGDGPGNSGSAPGHSGDGPGNSDGRNENQGKGKSK